MKDTPDSFDRHVKSKLDEVEVDPSLADTYWQQMQLPVVKQTGANKFRRYYWFSASVILTMLVMLAVTKSDRKLTNNFNTKIIQQPGKATPINMYDTVTMMNEKQIAVSQTKAELYVTKKDGSDKSGSPKQVFTDNQTHNKPAYDSIFHHQATATLNSSDQLEEFDTARLTKENLLQTGIQQANINLEKIDSINKKLELKKKAPYIIW